MEDQEAVNAGGQEQEKEPDFVVELHVQNLAEALEDYFVKCGLFIEGDHFEKVFIPLDMKFVSPGMTFLFAANVVPSELRNPSLHVDNDLNKPVDPKKLN